MSTMFCTQSLRVTIFALKAHPPRCISSPHPPLGKRDLLPHLFVVGSIMGALCCASSHEHTCKHVLRRDLASRKKINNVMSVTEWYIFNELREIPATFPFKAILFKRFYPLVFVYVCVCLCLCVLVYFFFSLWKKTEPRQNVIELSLVLFAVWTASRSP